VRSTASARSTGASWRSTHRRRASRRVDDALRWRPTVTSRTKATSGCPSGPVRAFRRRVSMPAHGLGRSGMGRRRELRHRPSCHEVSLCAPGGAPSCAELAGTLLFRTRSISGRPLWRCTWCARRSPDSDRRQAHHALVDGIARSKWQHCFFGPEPRAVQWLSPGGDRNGRTPRFAGHARRPALARRRRAGLRRALSASATHEARALRAH